MFRSRPPRSSPPRGGQQEQDGRRDGAGRGRGGARGWLQSAGFAGLAAGSAPPVRPVKGQIMRLRSTPATRATGLPPGLLRRTVRGIVRGSSVYLVSTRRRRAGNRRDPGRAGRGHHGHGRRSLGAASRCANARSRHHRARAGRCSGGPAAGHAGQRAGARAGRAAWPGAGDRAFPGGVLLAPVTADTVAHYLLTGLGRPAVCCVRAGPLRVGPLFARPPFARPLRRRPRTQGAPRDASLGARA